MIETISSNDLIIWVAKNSLAIVQSFNKLMKLDLKCLQKLNKF
jgi:hypothetical protein